MFFYASQRKVDTVMDMLLIVFSVLLASVGQLMLKYGLNKAGVEKVSSLAHLLNALANPIILAGLAVFGVSALVWITALSRVKLSVAYPVVSSLGYVTIIFLSWLILKEPVERITIVGCLVIIFGVFLISRGIQ